MPHLILFEKEAGTEAITHRFGSHEEFVDRLVRQLAESYRVYADEVLDIDKHIIVHPVIATSSMPVDVFLQIVTWRTPAREQAAPQIQHVTQRFLYYDLDTVRYITTNASVTVVDITDKTALLSVDDL